MFVIQLNSMPTRSRPKGTTYMHEMGGATIELTRGIMAKRMISAGYPRSCAHEVSSQAQQSWTDFPEHGLTARIFPHPNAAATQQCTGECADGSRCVREVSDPRTNRCWQHR